jgi:molecular chaperone GrpE
MQGDTTGESEPRQEGSAAEDPPASVGPAGEATAEAAPDPLAEAKAEAARTREALLRTAADFDNFRKRTRRELEEARRAGREDLLRSLLPVFDNLERAIQSALRTSDVKSMADGLSMIRRQFVEALGREGISSVPTVGQAFDPNVHEAIQQVETDEHPAGTVIAEIQPGYVQGERLIRAAMVVVAQPKASTSDETPN